MGQIVLWDKFSHKGNKSLIALLDFISNTGEYIIMVCHAQKVVDQMFSRVSVHIARKSPLRFPILQDLVREAPSHAKGQHLQNIWVYRQMGNSSKVPLVGHSRPHHYNFVKEDARMACQFKHFRSQEEAPTVAVPAMQVLCELTRNLKKQSTVIHFRHTLFYIFKS